MFFRTLELSLSLVFSESGHSTLVSLFKLPMQLCHSKNQVRVGMIRKHLERKGNASFLCCFLDSPWDEKNIEKESVNSTFVAL